MFKSSKVSKVHPPAPKGGVKQWAVPPLGVRGRLRSSLFIFHFSFFIIFAGCYSERIPERKLVKILAEIHFVDALVAEQSTGKKVMSQADSVAVYGPIFAKYNASFSQLHSSLMPYVGNKEKMAVLYEKVVKILEKNEKKYAEQLAVYQKEQERLLNLEIDAQHHYCR